jgi:branched-chain amino acid transport system substrate-binding protein
MPVKLIFVSFLICCGSFAYAENLPAVKIGVVAPLTGSAQSSGVSVKNSMTLAKEAFDKSDKVKFLFEDDQFSPVNTVTIVNRLIKQDKIQALVVYGTQTSLAVNSIAETTHIPMVGFSIVDRVVQGKSWVMKHWVPAETENQRLVAEVKKRNYKTIAAVVTINEAMTKLRDLFLQTSGMNLVSNDEMQREETDFRTVATKIVRLNPDAVYSLLWAPQPGIFAKQLRELGYKGEIFGAHNLEDPNEVRVSDGALEGAWFVSADDGGAANFYKQYYKRFAENPSAGGTNGYDVAKMLIGAANSPVPINQYLHELKDFEGVLGKYSATKNNDFSIQAALKKIVSGNFERLDRQ